MCYLEEFLEINLFFSLKYLELMGCYFTYRQQQKRSGNRSNKNTNACFNFRKVECIYIADIYLNNKHIEGNP
jgi:hypothetical protein